MGFFATFSTWLNGMLSTYIGTNTAKIATLITPAIATLATVYVMVWGYLQLTGKIEEPFATGVKRIILLVVILGGALNLWLYNDLIVDTFFNSPGELAAGVIGAYDSVGIIDQIIFTGGDAASLLIQKGGIFNGDFSYYLAGFCVYFIVGVTAIYAMFLLALSKIALSVLLALGPLFIALLFFETTKRFFEAWIAQLANYAFITILTVMVSALMLGIVSSVAQQAADLGGGLRRRDLDCRCGAGVHGRGPHVSHYAPGHADGGGTRERVGALLLWTRECGARLGPRQRVAPYRTVRTRLDRSGNHPLGPAVAQSRLLPGARLRRRFAATRARG
jgi:type IV secretory pathway VirB6-like protein